MIVEDNRRGFYPIETLPSGSSSTHFGLLGIRGLLPLVSSTLKAEPALGQGCTLYVRVPL